MVINATIFEKKIQISSINLELKNSGKAAIDILRLDQIHKTISGNKWYKLKYNLLEAEKRNASAVLSFGGAYSNHLHALAYAGKIFGIKTIGIVRGEKVENPTLQDCQNWGMELHFISRSDYRQKTETDFLDNLENQFSGAYIIPEGGDNTLGQKGCTQILNKVLAANYDILCCSVGTGTTIKGLASTFNKNIEINNKQTGLSGKEVWGFAPFKNAHSLREKISTTIPNLQYIDDYHFGGFGKIKPELERFIADFYKKYNIELDRVYTAKMFFGLQQELSKTPNLANKKILAIHTGGLQGNRSLY